MNQHISYTTIGEETMIVNSKLNKTLTLDEKGTEIWKLICQKFDEDQVINQLIDKYPNYSDEISSDVKDFFKLLKEYEILD